MKVGKQEQIEGGVQEYLFGIGIKIGIAWIVWKVFQAQVC